MNEVGLWGGADRRCGGAGVASDAGGKPAAGGSGAAGLDLGKILGLIGEVLRAIAASLGTNCGGSTPATTSASIDRGPAADGPTFRLQGTRLRDVPIQSFAGSLRRPGS